MKSFFTVILISFCTLAFSQTEKGKFFVGASSDLSFTSTSNSGVDDNVNTFNISATGGQFVVDNLLIGLNVGFSTTSFQDQNNNSITIGPRARYYVTKAFFGVGYNFFNFNQSSNFGDSDISGNQINFEGGYALFVNDKIAVEPSINYSIGGGDALDGINALSINIGFALYF